MVLTVPRYSLSFNCSEPIIPQQINVKRLQGRVPSYLTNLLVLTGETHSRQTRYAKFNIACPRVNRNTEGGRTFTVTACREWNKLPLQMRKAETLKTSKNSLWNRIFKDQQSLNHFSI